MTSEASTEAMYLTTKEFAGLVRLSEKTVYRIASTDPTFPTTRVGGSIRIPRERALRWLAKRTSGR